MLFKKATILLFLLSFSFITISANTEINLKGNYESLHDRNGTGWIKYTKFVEYLKANEDERSRKAFKLSFKDTEQGYSFNSDLNCHVELTPISDFWFGVNYADDEILNIDNRMDWKLGVGLYLLKDKTRFTEHNTKISYGLVFRENRYLHSWRLKDSFRFFILGYDMVASYIYPFRGYIDQKELRVRFDYWIEVFKFKPGGTIMYEQTETRVHFDMLVGVGFKF